MKLTLFTTGDTNLHLEPLLHGGSALEVLGGGLDVPVDGLLREIDHVRREERLALLLEVSLIGIEHTIEPREELLGAVVGVEDDRDAVCGSKRANVVGSSDGAGNGSALVTVGNTLSSCQSDVNGKKICWGTYLSGEVGSTTLGELKDDGGLSIAGSLEGSDDSGRRGDVLKFLVLAEFFECFSEMIDLQWRG